MQRLYLEGFEDEELISRTGGNQNARQHTHQVGGRQVTDTEESTKFSGQPGEFAAFGFNETTL